MKIVDASTLKKSIDIRSPLLLKLQKLEVGQALLVGPSEGYLEMSIKQTAYTKSRHAPGTKYSCRKQSDGVIAVIRTA